VTSWEGGRGQGSRVLRVGLLLLAALVALAAGIFFIGEQNNLFVRKNRYSINFESVSGVKPGNPVQLDGVDVGAVKEVILPREPQQKFIRVWISVDRRYAERIRAPEPVPASKAGLPPWTQARIKTLGLLGDKYVELTSGSSTYPMIPSDGRIPSATPTNVDALIASGEDVMDNVVEISHSLSTILARMERGEGLLGELTSDSESGRRMRQSMVSTFERVDRIAAKVESGEGPLPRLLNDRALADRLTGSMERFEALLASAQDGPGLLPALLKDPGARQSFDQTLATLNQVAQDLQRMTADLDQSEALMPRLLKDEEYGRQVTAAVRQIVERLNSVADKLDRGEGSAAKLINDPQIYDAVKDVMVGINESRLLRWLIRNRQKAGIKKRYEETRKELESQGTPVPPLPREGKEIEEESPEAPPVDAGPESQEAKPADEGQELKPPPPPPLVGAPPTPPGEPAGTEPPPDASAEPTGTEPPPPSGTAAKPVDTEPASEPAGEPAGTEPPPPPPAGART
jgi:phospholipid/cholesterol/gamma-HCH transport system substrate-binding protein